MDIGLLKFKVKYAIASDYHNAKPFNVPIVARETMVGPYILQDISHFSNGLSILP
mgnify:CR=1 FL=1